MEESSLMARRKTAFSSFQAVGKDLRRFSAEEQFYPAVKLSSHIKAVIHFGKMIKKKKKKQFTNSWHSLTWKNERGVSDKEEHLLRGSI